VCLALLLATAVAAVGCGKKGPPLPPLVLLPAPPGDFVAVRRGAEVDLTFRIPDVNTDRSSPADLSRVDVFAWTVPGAVSAEDVVQRGTRVGTVSVNKPKDPDEPEPKVPAPKGPGLEQKEIATFSEPIRPQENPASYRAYVAVGFSTRGRRGALSPRIAVPLVAPPPAPAQPDVTYDEKAITVSWAPVPSDGPPHAYSVYRPDPAAPPLTAAPVADPKFVDSSIEWEQERCYQVRTVATVEGVRVESGASPAQCVTLHDQFAPVKPEGLVGVGSEGAISLIWTANREADLAGYIVLRAVAPATELAPVTPSPITDSNFRDVVPAGSRVTYAVQAVDKSGNRSQPSNTIAETAR
jgi:hypothetical protein